MRVGRGRCICGPEAGGLWGWLRLEQGCVVGEEGLVVSSDQQGPDREDLVSQDGV